MFKCKLFIGAAICFFICACEKDSSTEAKTNAVQAVSPGVIFNFNALANGKVLVPNTGAYTNSSKDNFTVAKFSYYISNIKLIRNDGVFFSERESYHMVQHVEGKTSFTIANVPEGNYTGIEFLIGVDSARNVSGVQYGALDVANDMFWDWRQGYIFFKMEGAYNTQSMPQTSSYGIHIGGYSGKYKCLQTCKFNLSTAIIARSAKQSSVSYNVLIDEIFMNPYTIGFDNYFANNTFETFQKISENYRDMFVVDKVEN